MAEPKYHHVQSLLYFMVINYVTNGLQMLDFKHPILSWPLLMFQIYAFAQQKAYLFKVKRATTLTRLR